MVAQALPLAWLAHEAEIRLWERCGSEARLEAELLLAHALGHTRTQLYTQLTRFATEEELHRFSALLGRRLAGEPLAYITGHREFYGLDLAVNRNVLVPRPETEFLVEVVLATLSASQARPAGDGHVWQLSARQRPAGEWRIVDVGTGSGAIAIALASRLPSSKIFAIDVSPEALDVASYNCQRHGVASQVTLLHGDLLSPLREKVDAIVANLPYVPSRELAHLQVEVREYEPHQALDGGPDGLSLYRRLLPQARQKLQPAGFIALEMGAGQKDEMYALARHCFPDASIRVLEDFAGIPRVIVIEAGDSTYGR